MPTKLMTLSALCLLVLIVYGCVPEIPLEKPSPREQPGKPQAPVPPSPREQAALKLTEQGRRFLKDGKPDNAIRVLEQAISLNPDNGQNYYFLAEAWLMKEIASEAREFNRLAEMNLKNNQEWMIRVAKQADRIAELEK